MAKNDKKGKAGAGRAPAVPPVYQPRSSGRPAQAKAAPSSRQKTAAPPVFKAQGSQRTRAPRVASGRAAQAKMSRTIQMAACPQCGKQMAFDLCFACGYNPNAAGPAGPRGQMDIMPNYPGGNVPVNEITHIGNKRVK